MTAEPRDSMAVRLEIVRQVEAGEITLADAQKYLRRLKREARDNGELTYHQIMRDKRR